MKESTHGGNGSENNDDTAIRYAEGGRQAADHPTWAPSRYKVRFLFSKIRMEKTEKNTSVRDEDESHR
jgi:hypothetical protein